MASGRPVIVSKGIGDLDQMFANTKAGIFIDHEDTLQTIAEQIMALVNNKDTPERCRELAMSHFNMEDSIDKYIEIYGRMQN